MATNASHYYHRSVRGTWYVVKAVSKSLFFLLLGLLIGFLISDIEILEGFTTQNKIIAIVAFILVLIITLVLWLFSRESYYAKVNELHQKDKLQLLKSLHQNNDLSVDVLAREQAKLTL